MNAKPTGDGSVARSGIEHIVALVLENRSFDHLLGDLGRSGALPVDGGTAPMMNRDINGREVTLGEVRSNVTPDLPHDFGDVVISLMDENGGFVRADQLFHRGKVTADPRRVMSYYPTDSLPVTHRLAREYSVSDAWFASVPAGTWPNRLFLVASSSEGQVTNTLPGFLYDMPTVFDRLAVDDWAIYTDQLPNVALIKSLGIEFAKSKLVGGHFHSMRRFEEECARGTLRAFSFIEPVYLGDANDSAHPPGDILRSEHLIGRVYAALRRSPLWERTLLLVLYDEHGGFFDHVSPPDGVPSPGSGAFGFDFTRLGVRVPCLIVSSYAPRGGVFRPPKGGFIDHTSLIATVLRQRDLGPLTPRDEAVTDVWGALMEGRPRTDDDATMNQVVAWTESQNLALTRDIVGPLDPQLLAERPGRDIAAAIIAAAPRAPSSALYRDAGTGVGAEIALAGGRDATLEEAQVALAQAILALPPDPAEVQVEDPQLVH